MPTLLRNLLVDRFRLAARPLLSRMVGAPVVDETALTGVYDLKLEWTPRLSADGGGAADLSIFSRTEGLWPLARG